MIVIAFAGPGGAGKTTAANMLVDMGFTRISFAGPLYDMLEAGGFGRPKTLEEKQAIIPSLGFSWRHAAQTLGTEWGRQMLRDDIWTMLALRKCMDPDGRYVIDDLRFENEATALRQIGHVVHITGRKGDLGQNAGHASEAGVKAIDGDYHLDNGVGDLSNLAYSLNNLIYQVEHE